MSTCFWKSLRRLLTVDSDRNFPENIIRQSSNFVTGLLGQLSVKVTKAETKIEKENLRIAKMLEGSKSYSKIKESQKI